MIQDFLISHYTSLKALHIIAVISWMAGLLYLPRLFVYHADALRKSAVSDTFKIMERRLYRFIMRPAMVMTWVFGLTMLHANPGLMGSGWFHAKLGLVVAMTGLHHVFGAWMRKFAEDKNDRPAKFYRWWNEAPTLLMVVIVFLAVTKPF